MHKRTTGKQASRQQASSSQMHQFAKFMDPVTCLGAEMLPGWENHDLPFRCGCHPEWWAPWYSKRSCAVPFKEEAIWRTKAMAICDGFSIARYRCWGRVGRGQGLQPGWSMRNMQHFWKQTMRFAADQHTRQVDSIHILHHITTYIR